MIRLWHRANAASPRSAIAHLLLSGGPFAVVRRIRAIVVDPFDSMACCRSLPHIGIEGCEVIAPTIAYRDASAAVVVPVLLSWICASRNHSLPYQVFRRWIAITAKPVAAIWVALSQAFFVKTPAAIRSAANKRAGMDRLSGPAVASAFPEPAARIPDNKQSSESLAAQFNALHFQYFTSIQNGWVCPRWSTWTGLIDPTSQPQECR